MRNLIRRADDAAMRELINAAQSESLTDQDLAELSRGLAVSGECLPVDVNAADIASTGGPSSLSTLLCPLYLRGCGLVVPKLGVPGRPAGGIDVLQQITGYEPDLSSDDARRALRRHGYVHLLANQRWAPLDARLFAYRQKEGAQTLPALVIASILAKKIAAGAVGAGLEIRIAPHGNFGVDLQSARQNAHRFRAVADELGLRAVAILTDATRPFQPFIGRGEALIALHAVLSGTASDWLAEHASTCRQMASAMAHGMGASPAAKEERASPQQAHEAVLTAHGTSTRQFEDRVTEIRNAPRSTIHASKQGSVEFDLALMRRLLVERQRAEPLGPVGSPPDPAGVILLVRPGSEVVANQPVMSVRASDADGELLDRLANCVRIYRGGSNEDGFPGTLVEII